MENTFYKITLIVPTRDKTGKQLYHAEVAEYRTNVEMVFGTEFGGWTVTPAQGGWISGRDIINEDVFVYTSSTDKLSDVQIEKLETLAGAMAFMLNQDAVFLQIEEVKGFVKFIPQNTDF